MVIFDRARESASTKGLRAGRRFVIGRRAMRVALPSASTKELLSHIAPLGDAQIACNSQLLSQNGVPDPHTLAADQSSPPGPGGAGVVTRPPGHPGEGANCSGRRGPGGYLEE